jgi:hypothetical protein
MTQRIILSLRDAAKGKSSEKDVSDGLYTGARQGVSIKADDAVQPLEITVLLKDMKDKDRVLGLELNGNILPWQPLQATPDRLASVRGVYKQYKQAIIRAISLYVPRG